jgi:hypothetical protein
MTADERLGRIEHLTAGIAEERRRGREEYKNLWRDQQRQMDSLRGQVEALAVETRLRFDQVADRFDQVGQRFEQVGERIDNLVSAIGELTRAIVAKN